MAEIKRFTDIAAILRGYIVAVENEYGSTEDSNQLFSFLSDSAVDTGVEQLYEEWISPATLAPGAEYPTQQG